MTAPNNFISTTDFPTIKNNENTSTIVVQIPASIWLNNANPSYEIESTATIGDKGSLLRVTCISSRDGREFTGTSFMTIGEGATIYGPTPYPIMIDVYRRDSTTVVAHVYIPNTTYPFTTIVTEPIVETITVKVTPFLSPFNE